MASRSRATASAGAAARLRPSTALWLLGTATLLASVVAFLLLLAGLWIDMDIWGDESVWRAFGCIAVLGAAGAHACGMLGALRRSDTETVRLLTFSSVAVSAFDTLAIILPLLKLIDDVDETWARVFGATLVLLILTSVLPAILRRIQTVAPRPSAASESTAPGDEFLATTVIRIADRIELLNSDPGNRAPEIQAEVRRLRKLAEGFQT